MAVKWDVLMGSLGDAAMDTYKLQGDRADQAQKQAAAKAAEIRANQQSQLNTQLAGAQMKNYESTAAQNEFENKRLQSQDAALQQTTLANKAALEEKQRKNNQIVLSMGQLLNNDNKIKKSSYWPQIEAAIQSGDADRLVTAHNNYIENDLKQQELAGKNQKSNEITPYQQAQLDLAKKRIEQLQTKIDNQFKQATDVDKLTNLDGVLDKITTLETLPGFSAGVGAKGLTQGFGFLKEPVAGTEAADFKSQFSALQSMLTMENMGKMKGVLSDADIKIIRESSTALNPNMSENEFKKELEKVKAVTTAAKERLKLKLKSDSTATTESPVQDEFDTLWGN